MRFVIAVLCACGGGGSGEVLPDIDNGTCGAELRFTGEYVDWDNEQLFCGIFGAQFQLRGGAAADSTAPNGRFDLCLPAGTDRALLDITPPQLPSQCTNPAALYRLPSIASADREVILRGAFWTGKNFTEHRELTLGAALAPGKAHVLVHVAGAARDLTLDAEHDAPLAAGPEHVFFPNVTVGAGTATLDMAGGAFGAGDVTLEADKLTTLTVLPK
jgi:hypothetical protein